MAYVVARRGGRFEVRESVHTANGPRSRTLAGFRVLTADVVNAAGRRAQRPFDAEAVISSGRRAGARVQVASSEASRARDRFLSGSRWMAVALAKPALPAERMDAGMALLELLGFADAIAAKQPPRAREPLAFPPLARIVKQRAGPSSAP